MLENARFRGVRLQPTTAPRRARRSSAAGWLLAALALVALLLFTIRNASESASTVGLLRHKAQAAKMAGSTMVSVTPRRPGGGFVLGAIGLSVETDELDTRDLSSEDRALVELMRGLGPGVLRVGGNSVDHSWWTSDNEAPPSWAKSVVTPAVLSQLASLLRATGWRVILGVDLGHFDPARAAGEVHAAAETFGSRLMGVEVGNEPNNYASPLVKLRATAYSVTDYLDELAAYSTAIRAVTPTIRLYGPDLGSRALEAWLLTVAANTTVSFAAITEHYYPTKYNIQKGTCEGTSVPTASELLAPEVREKENAALRILSRAGQLARRETRISETNTTASCDAAGGPRTSPVFASALWALDWVLRSASAGVTGLNFHGYYGGCLPEGVSPICASHRTGNHAEVVARPEYYGLLAATQLEGGRFVPTEISAASAGDDLTAYATVHTDGAITVAIIDFAGQGRARLALKVPGYHQATSESLVGPSINATSGITLGGATIRTFGISRPRRTPLALKDGAFRLTVRPGSASIITLRR